MTYTLIGKKTGVYNDRKYFILYFAKPTDEGEGLVPVTYYSYCKLKVGYPCTDEVYRDIEVGEQINSDYILSSPTGKINLIRR